MVPDLTFVQTQQLLDELDKRYEHWIFSGLKTISKNPDRCLTERKWSGNSHTCSGLASMIQQAIYNDHIKENELDEFRGDL